MIRALLINELRLFSRDRKALLINFILPLILVSLFGLMYGAFPAKKNPVIGVFLEDKDNTPISKQWVAYLNSYEQIKVLSYDRVDTKSPRVIIHKGFKDLDSVKNHVSLILSPENEIENITVMNVVAASLAPLLNFKARNKQVRGLLERFHGELDSASIAFMKELIKQKLPKSPEFNAQGALELPFGLSYKEEETKTPIGTVQAISGTAIMLLLFSVIGSAGALIDQRKDGTLERVYLCGMSPIKILVAKGGALLAISFTQLLIVYLYGAAVLGYKTASWPALLLLVACGSLASTSFGLAFACVLKTRKQVEGLATLIILCMSAIGGSMVPLYVMPNIMRSVAKASVNFWFIEGNYVLNYVTPNWSSYMQSVLILFAIGSLVSITTLLSIRKGFFVKN